MSDYKFRFTVFTPCFNSEKFIHRVFESLQNQTFRDFEWYVIDDASADNTATLIEDYIKTVDFPVRFLRQTKNSGVLKNVNRAIKDAHGEYLVLYGHDDRITQNSLEVFDTLLQKYESQNIGGVYGLAKDQEGKLVGKKFVKNDFVSNYWVEFFDNENEEEKFQCWKTNYLREFAPIPTDKPNEQPGAWLWGKFGTKYNHVFTNEVLRVYYTNVPGQITSNLKRDKNPEMIFNYYTYWVNEFQYFVSNKRRRYRGIAGYVSYGLLARKGIWNIISRVNGVYNKLLCLLFIPIAILYNKR